MGLRDFSAGGYQLGLGFRVPLRKAYNKGLLCGGREVCEASKIIKFGLRLRGN